MVAKIFFYIAASIGITIFQSVILGNVLMIGIKPNLFIVIVVCAALTTSVKEAITVGFCIGFIADAISGRWMGFNTFLSAGTTYFVILINNKFFRENNFVGVLLTFIATIFYELTVLIFQVAELDMQKLFFAIKFIIFPEAAINGILALVLLALFRRINTFLSIGKVVRKY